MYTLKIRKGNSGKTKWICIPVASWSSTEVDKHTVELVYNEIELTNMDGSISLNEKSITIDTREEAIFIVSISGDTCFAVVRK